MFSINVKVFYLRFLRKIKQIKKKRKNSNLHGILHLYSGNKNVYYKTKQCYFGLLS